MPHNPTQQSSADVPKVDGSDSNKNGSGSNFPVPVIHTDFASDVSTSEAGAENDYEMKDTLKVNALMADNKGKAISTTTLNKNDKTAISSVTLATNVSSTNSPLPGRNRALSGIDPDMVSEYEPSSSDSGFTSRCAVVKPLKFRLCQPIFGKRFSKNNQKDDQPHRNKEEHKKHSNKKKKQAAEVNELEPIQKPKVRDPEKEKRRIARKKEKRATLILGK